MNYPGILSNSPPVLIVTVPSSCGDNLSKEEDADKGKMAPERCRHDETRDLSLPPQEELLALRMQIMRQREEIDALASRLEQYEANETNETPSAAEAKEDEPAERYSSQVGGNAGPLKMLIELNSDLTAENARLQALVDVTRRSLRSHLEESRRTREDDRRAIEALSRENKLLRMPWNAATKKSSSFACARLSTSDHTGDDTARTSLMSSVHSGSIAEEPMVDCPLPEVRVAKTKRTSHAAGEDSIERAAKNFVRRRAARRQTVDCGNVPLAMTGGGRLSRPSPNDGPPTHPTSDSVAKAPRLPRRNSRRHTVDETDRGGKEEFIVSFSDLGGGDAPRGWWGSKNW